MPAVMALVVMMTDVMMMPVVMTVMMMGLLGTRHSGNLGPVRHDHWGGGEEGEGDTSDQTRVNTHAHRMFPLMIFCI